MQVKHFALSAAALLAIFSGSLHADTFEPNGVRVGVDYRIAFGGSIRSKADAPTFGVNVNLTSAQDTLGVADARSMFGNRSYESNKLIDVRFDSKTQNLRSMYVGGVSVLRQVTRNHVDGAPGVVDTVVSWPLVATGIVGFYVWADQRVSEKKSVPAPPLVVTFSDSSDSSLGITYAGFSNPTQP